MNWVKSSGMLAVKKVIPLKWGNKEGNVARKEPVYLMICNKKIAKRMEH